MFRRLAVIFSLIAFPAAGFAQQRLPPTPYGGQIALKPHIENEMVYPRKALREKTEGMVNLFFIVDQNGKTHNLKVWQSLSPETDAEAIRIFNKILWLPAQMGNMKMASEHYLRVKFNLRKYKKMVKHRGYDFLPVMLVPEDTTEKVWRTNDIDTMATCIVPEEFPGLSEYLSFLVNYPKDAFQLSIEGSVELEFVVEQHGGVSNIRALEWLGGGCYEEAVRLCKATRWIPAIKYGMAVRSFAHITIDFVLPKAPVLGQ